jgi:perosamine synthetase
MFSRCENLIFKAITKVAKKKMNISLHAPFIDRKDSEAILKTLKKKNISTYGKTTTNFEKKLKNYIKSKFVIALNSGTSALHLCILASGITKNQEILIPALNFIASSNAAIYNSSIPHYIDCDYELGINIDKLKNYLDQNTKIIKKKCININTGRVIRGIIPTHIFGRIRNIDQLKILSAKYKLILIEDASEAFGSFYKKKHAGTFGHCGALSFNGNKIISTGGGGALVTNSKKIYLKAKYLASVSKIEKNNFSYHDDLGFNYRMPSLNAALGISQLKKIKFIKKKKYNNYLNYKKQFLKNNYFDFMIYNNISKENNYWLNYVIFKNKNLLNKNFFKFFKKKNIEIRRVWSLNNKGRLYSKFPKMDLSASKDLEAKILCLPSGVFK